MNETAAKSFTLDWRSERAFVTMSISSKNMIWKTACISNRVFQWTKTSRFPFLKTMSSGASMINNIVLCIFNKLLHAISIAWHLLLPGSKPWDHKPLKHWLSHKKVQKDAWSTMLTNDINSWHKLKRFWSVEFFVVNQYVCWTGLSLKKTLHMWLPRNNPKEISVW